MCINDEIASYLKNNDKTKKKRKQNTVQHNFMFVPQNKETCMKYEEKNLWQPKAR